MGQKKPRQNTPGRGKPKKLSSYNSSNNPQNGQKKSSFFAFLNKNLFLVGLVAGVALPCFPYGWLYENLFGASSNSDIPTFKVVSPDEFKGPSLPEYQRVSLFEPYAVDYKAVLKVREENMKKYSYNYSKTGIDKRSGLSLQEYWDVYDGKWPVVVTDVVPTWQASNWTRDFFNQHYGKERVTMKAVDNSLDEAVSLALPLELFYKNTHEAYPNRWTYIEDELFITMRPQLKQHIGDCDYLSEDFYQLFPSAVRPWNAMLLWGTKYSRSTLHIDPYNWTGTNAVFQGRKRWKMYPPMQDKNLYVREGRKSGFPLDCYKYNSPIDSFEPDLTKYTKFAFTNALEFDLLPGEMLIIPTGWFHQAFNMEETIAISSQVMNTNNVRIVLEEILKVGNVRRSQLPKDIDSMSPAKQVEAVMAMLPEGILKHGKEVTQDALDQVSGKKVIPELQEQLKNNLKRKSQSYN